jgi:superfamily II DNA helicase RecQ
VRELKVFNLPFCPHQGFDDLPLQQWLQSGRHLLKQESHLVKDTLGTWLVILVETELLPGRDPYQRVALVKDKNGASLATKQVNHSANSARQRQRSEARKKRKRDVEAAMIRLDERGRTLFNILRSWRTSRAAEEGMPAYEFGSDLLLCEVAQRRPVDSASLRALPSCKPRLYKLAGEELLTLLQAFEAGEELAWHSELHSEPAKPKDSSS